MSTVETLPRWDMEVVYPSPQSDQFNADFQTIVRDLKELAGIFDDYGIEKRPDVRVDDRTVEGFEKVTDRFSAVLERVRTLNAYLGCLTSADSRDDVAQTRSSELEQEMVRFSQLDTRLTGWIGSMDVQALMDRSATARQYSYLLQRTSEEARHLMSEGEEFLAAELDLTGGSAWNGLYADVTSQLMVPIEIRGEQKDLPMSIVKNLAFDPDREVRHAAYQAETRAWINNSVTVSAALNSIKGQTNTLCRRRGWASALELSLFNNAIDAATLDAMMEAARQSFPNFRRYLHAKAKVLGIPRLAWYDLFAPVGGSSREWHFEEARDFLIDRLGTYTPVLSDFVARAFAERWIDAEPREGKRGGAFCMPLRGDESRVLSNFKPAYEGMSTLAHELGHAYHFHNLAQRPILMRSTPMTLAETASIFCETLVREAALDQADHDEQMAILEASLQGACQIVVDISSRFLFERSLFEARLQREQTVDELCEMMLTAQRETFGDGLDQDQLQPYAWANKQHYYSADFPYYNFPYMFGQLFGVGLYARYRQDPEKFTTQYDDLLASTGEADAAPLAARFGIDIRSPEFWAGSLGIIGQDIDRFVELAG